MLQTSPLNLIARCSPSDLALFEQQTIEMARKNSATFTQYVYNYHNAPFHNAWHQFINTHRYGQLLAYRGSGKSQQLTIPLTCWEIGRNPNIRIKIATESDKLAVDIMTAIESTLLESERYHNVFPEIQKSKRGLWGRKAMTVKRSSIGLKDPTVEASGILTARTGARSDLSFFDDISGLRNALVFPKNREIVKQAFYSNWLNMRDDPQTFRWYNVGTPWHIDDVVSEIRSNSAIPKCTEVAVGPNFESPWPERHSPDFFREQMLIQHRIHFNRAYRLIALDDSETWMDKQALMNARDFTLKAPELIANKEIMKFIGVDLGHRTGEDQCPSVIFALGMFPDHRRVPLDIRISHDAAPLSIMKVIIDMCQRVEPAIVMVENVGAQEYLVDLLKQLGPGTWRVEGFFTGQQKFNPETGVPSMFAEIENGKWSIPLGMGGPHDDTCACNHCTWIGELLDYPHGKRSDTVMASWLALQGLRKLVECANAGGSFSVWDWSN